MLSQGTAGARLTKGVGLVLGLAGRLEVVEANVAQLKVARAPALVAPAALVELALESKAGVRLRADTKERERCGGTAGTAATPLTPLVRSGLPTSSGSRARTTKRQPSVSGHRAWG